MITTDNRVYPDYPVETHFERGEVSQDPPGWPKYCPNEVGQGAHVRQEMIILDKPLPEILNMIVIKLALYMLAFSLAHRQDS